MNKSVNTIKNVVQNNINKGGSKSMNNIKEINKKAGNETMKNTEKMREIEKLIETIKENPFTITKIYFENAGFNTSFLNNENEYLSDMNDIEAKKIIAYAIMEYHNNPLNETITKIISEGENHLFSEHYQSIFNKKFSDEDRSSYFKLCMLYIGLMIEWKGIDYIRELHSMAREKDSLKWIFRKQGKIGEKMLKLWACLITAQTLNKTAA